MVRLYLTSDGLFQIEPKSMREQGRLDFVPLTRHHHLSEVRTSHVASGLVGFDRFAAVPAA